MKIKIFAIATFLVLLGCKQIQKATDVVTQPTAREVYERDFDDENLQFTSWKAAYNRAFNDSLKIELPYTETGVFNSENHLVYSYLVFVQEGEKLVISTELETDSLSVFIDLFQKKNDSIFQQKPKLSNEPSTASVTYESTKNETIKLIIQPELAANTSFSFKIYSVPTYGFPVSGATNKNIQSYWGATRDGGKRSHEGVDIFAERGTPILAVTDGRISSTGNRGLGGKQVWLRDGLFGSSVYYAHLDSIATSSGKRVKRGDTLGFVGNTGNAKTTAPHLHFGIYKGYSGAINPLPFIKKQEIPEVKNANTNLFGTVTRNNAKLRLGSSTKFQQIASLQKNDSVSILGKNNSWYHIQKNNSLKGFIHQSLLKPTSSN
ncbi:M23 family metallopeptidase [Marixanthomonas ophiurae]|uniref:M23 family peptidase n=1 Tax=Marixanthomonas ophiurae TaxID=387659 RepID=A0A3E1QBH3_9FLAO|nr:M23 family metallopeptidase [Marixanthomonas ophiurae]RFN59492.1 M23 family peptidase [Marixanthomonas ophiurae]